MIKAIIILLLGCVTTGCVTTVYPQPKVAEPTVVFIADYGIHSALLLPTGNGRYVEYAFGDWNFAALNHCWPQDALGALLVSYQSTLGRRFVDVHPGQKAPHPCHPEPHHVIAVYVSRAQVDKVVKELDDRYRAGGKIVVYNPDNQTSYVKDSQHYSVANNCNHLTARCLREMGCDVRGLIVISNFTVAQERAQTAEEPPKAPSIAATPLIQSAGAN